MFLKIGTRAHNLLQTQSIDLGTVESPRVTLRYPGIDPIVLNADASRKVRNYLTNGEARVIECDDLPDPTPAPEADPDPTEVVTPEPPAKDATATAAAPAT